MGTHLPTRSEEATASTLAQMNTSPATWVHNGSRSTKKERNVVSATIVSDPPIQIGLVTQYRTWLTPATNRPNASLVHTYGPPSSGKAVPSSATSSP